MSEKRAVALFLVLAFAISWAWLVPMALSGGVSQPGQGWPTHLPALLGPGIAGVIATAYLHGKQGLVALWKRLFRWSSPGMLAVIGLIALAGIAVITQGLATGTWPSAQSFWTYNGTPVTVGPLAVFLYVLVINGFGEEIGWRGFLADLLLRRQGAVGEGSLLRGQGDDGEGLVSRGRGAGADGVYSRGKGTSGDRLLSRGQGSDGEGFLSRGQGNHGNGFLSRRDGAGKTEIVRVATVLFIPWAAWHLPMFFSVAGFKEMGLMFPGWLFALWCGSVVLTWLYAKSGNVFVVALWHTIFNFVSGTPAADSFMGPAVSVVVMVAAGVIVFFERRRRVQ